jgi:lysophospholipase L1-like esterase
MIKIMLLVCLFLAAPHFPECLNRESLKNYDQRVSKIKAGQNSIINIVWLGDSLTQMEFITHSLRTRLQSQLGNAGMGFIRFDSSASVIFTVVSSSGQWAERDQSPAALGLHINDSTSSEPRARKKIELKSDIAVDSITIHYIRQPTEGKFRYRIDDGPWHKVKTKGKEVALATKQIDLSPEYHILTVEVVSGTVTLIGADYQLGDRGVKVHMIGNTASRASEWAKVDPVIWQQGLAALNPALVVIQFSTNEQSLLESPASLVAAYTALISRIRAAAPQAGILLTTDPDTANSVNPSYWPTSAYSDAVRGLAVSLDVGFIDFYREMGLYASANERGLYGDTVHVSEAGGRILADSVSSYLNKECAGTISLRRSRRSD